MKMDSVLIVGGGIGGLTAAIALRRMVRLWRWYHPANECCPRYGRDWRFGHVSFQGERF